MFVAVLYSLNYPCSNLNKYSKRMTRLGNGLDLLCFYCSMTKVRGRFQTNSWKSWTPSAAQKLWKRRLTTFQHSCSGDLFNSHRTPVILFGKTRLGKGSFQFEVLNLSNSLQRTDLGMPEVLFNYTLSPLHKCMDICWNFLRGKAKFLSYFQRGECCVFQLVNAANAFTWSKTIKYTQNSSK